MTTGALHPVVREKRGGFTLLEIMIVVGFLALIVGMAVPSILGSLRKEGMRKAVSDMVEACVTARSTAILTSHAVDLVIHPFERTFSVMAASGGSEGDLGGGSSTEDAGPAIEVKSFSATLPRDVHIEILGVNFQEMQEAEEVRIRFYPNSTSDEFTILLRSDANELRKISLEIVTALADVEVVR